LRFRFFIAFVRWLVILVSKCQRNNSRNRISQHPQKIRVAQNAGADGAVVVVAARARPPMLARSKRRPPPK
jgi:hypothetical protein